ncbi:MAG: hypothetical protein AB2L20_12020 [Mangrovibacterium sp.]
MMEQILFTGLQAKVMPAVFEDLNNGKGTFLYNHNMRQEEVVTDPMTSEDNELLWIYDSLRVEMPKTAKNISSTLVSAKYPDADVKNMKENFDSATIGLLEESHKAPYVAYLTDKQSVKESVENDCITYNIPIE